MDKTYLATIATEADVLCVDLLPQINARDPRMVGLCLSALIVNFALNSNDPRDVLNIVIDTARNMMSAHESSAKH